MKSPFGMPDINDDVLIRDRKTGERKKFTVPWYNFIVKIAAALASTTLPQVAQSQIARIQERLTRDDAGLLLWVTDFNHILRFNGVAFEFAPGTERSNWYAVFDPAGPLPDANSGWIDTTGGPTVDVLLGDGTIDSVTVTATANVWYRI